MRKFAIRSALLTLFILAMSAASFGQVVIQVGFAPPPLPVYVQPICPGDGYIWVPGYWAWGADFDDYYWVPGTWVLAPEVGFFWTPGWWGWGNGFYLWHPGYWGPHVGFYGGINYGFGYFGTGFVGGRWEGGHFFYNREVTNINVTVIHNVYNERVNVREVNHVSFNGGHGGIDARPTREEESWDRERHIAPVSAQVEHRDMARSNEQLRASYNHGKPGIAATARPSNFSEHEPAREAGGAWNPPPKGGAHNAPATSGGSRNTSGAIHPKDLPPLERTTVPNTTDQRLNQKYQQQQEKLYNKQEQDRQKLELKQEQQHQHLQQQNASQQKFQQMEQTHQQQTQQMYDRHVQQRQQTESKQQTSHGEGNKH